MANGAERREPTQSRPPDPATARFPFRTSALVVGVAIIIPTTLIVLLKSYWLTWIERSPSLSAHWGDIASVIGVCLSYVGFVLTIMIAIQSKTAAEQARIAADRARQSVFHFDVIVELTEAVVLLDHIKAYHREKRWQTLPPRLDRLRTVLVSVAHPNSSLTLDQRTRVAGVLKQIKEVAEKIEKAVQSEKETGPARASGLFDVLNNQADELNNLLAELRLEEGNDSNGK